jgi:hypothetical protein
MMASKNPSSKLILVRSEERSVASCDAGEQRARNLCVFLPHLSPPRFVSCVSQADSASERREQVQVVYERCCGLDVHQKTVVGCRLLSQQKGTIEKSIRTFATTISGLMELDRWLAEGQVEQVALAHHGHLLASHFQSTRRSL